MLLQKHQKEQKAAMVASQACNPQLPTIPILPCLCWVSAYRSCLSVRAAQMALVSWRAAAGSGAAQVAHLRPESATNLNSECAASWPFGGASRCPNTRTHAHKTQHTHTHTRQWTKIPLGPALCLPGRSLWFCELDFGFCSSWEAYLNQK